MLARYQNDCLQKMAREDGAERWQFRWLHKGADGVSRERKKTIGLVKGYPENSRASGYLLALSHQFVQAQCQGNYRQ